MIWNPPYPVAEEKILRTVISADTANEADDPFAIAHALLTPILDVKAIIATHYGIDRHADSLERSYVKTEKLLSVMHYPGNILLHGEKAPIRYHEALSEGTVRIVEEALSGDLLILAFGPLSDIAAALRAEPSISSSLHVIWTGGGDYPDGGWEYNLFNDIEAASYVFSSGADIIQIPRSVYQRLTVSFSELYLRLGESETGEYLLSQLFEHSLEPGPRTSAIRSGDSWILGDNAAIGVLLSPRASSLKEINAPSFSPEGRYIYNERNGKIRIAERLDARFVLEDFFSKLRLQPMGKWEER
ncbi:MAG: nucleoside hydrolase [Spirochaetes bacterium]|uniref:Nucleoside hydrolase n=1 Tax=Candidatus Ornithospirochaeta stercoravium TaxID=2840897 RepID=A0A9D9NCA5_9SPIO|nr:nucleoside hydrolase [Candidatus Ornithospirochaeta stercoravium]